MQGNKTPIAIAAIALCSSLPAAGQTTLTMQAEHMSRSSTVVVEGSLIKLATWNTSGSAWQSFSGAGGKYSMQVHVLAEPDGQPTLEVYNGGTLLRRQTYPLGNGIVSFTINDVSLASGNTIKLVGRQNGGASARVDKVVFTQTAAAAPAPTSPTTPTTTTTSPTSPTASTLTMQAESMSRSSSVVIEGSLAKLATWNTAGSVWQNFSGAPGKYSMKVSVLAENDGQPTLEVYNGSTLLRRYTYPLGNGIVSFIINDVSLATGQTIKLTGRQNAGASARVDKIDFTKTGDSIAPTTPPPATTPPALTLPSTNTKAVATFHSLGVYWKPPSNPGSAGCNVQYREAGESTWKDGLAMWYDERDSECRGSLVYLTPGTDYQVQFGLPGQQPSAQLAAKTWSESFPIAKTVHLVNGTTNQPLNITEGGTAGGYVLYTSPPGGQTTIDVANAHNHAITISAPYVIVRGLVVKGAKSDAIRLLPGARDLVIEANDISGWGGYARTNAEGWNIGTMWEAGISARCDMSPSSPWLVRTVVQRNRIHHPRYGSNSWSEGHPSGSNGILYDQCGGNHVIRYNEIYSEWGRYFMDGIGGAQNFSAVGMPNSDSDIYGNRISHVWDDAIEAEGANRNVRIWSNYIDNTFVGIATTATAVGPVYVFRNVKNRSRKLSRVSLDNDQASTFGKPGQNTSFGNGRRYVFHNTTLQATEAGSTYPVGAGTGLGGAGSPMTNTVSRNNIWHIKKAHWSSIMVEGGWGNDFDYDLFNGNILAQAGSQTHGIVGTPIYQSGHGWSSESGGDYQLAPHSPGYDRGARLPNFNDDFSGTAPDMGAAEAGKPAMRFGVSGGQ